MLKLLGGSVGSVGIAGCATDGNESGTVSIFGREHKPLGKANLRPLTDPPRLEVGNIGSSGRDGVQVSLPTDIAIANFAFEPRLGNPSDPEDPVRSGAFMDFTPTGTVNDDPDQRLSTLHIEATESSVNVTADFSPQTESLMAQYFMNGQLIAREDGIPNDATWNFAAWVPDGVKICEHTAASVTTEMGLTGSFDVETPTGETLREVDTIRWGGTETDVTFGDFSNLKMTAADIPELRIDGEEFIFGEFAHTEAGQNSSHN